MWGQYLIWGTNSSISFCRIRPETKGVSKFCANQEMPYLELTFNSCLLSRHIDVSYLYCFLMCLELHLFLCLYFSLNMTRFLGTAFVPRRGQEKCLSLDSPVTSTIWHFQAIAQDLAAQKMLWCLLYIETSLERKVLISSLFV